MEKLRYVLAYILGILGWFVGLILGTIWALLYGGYQESNVIDLPTLLMEKITPAMVSVFLSDYIFRKIFPENKYRTTNLIIFYALLFLNYGWILSEAFYMKNYSNIIYVIAGVIYVICLMAKLMKPQDVKNV